MLNLFEFEYYCDLTNYIVKRNANFIPNVDLAIMAYVCPLGLLKNFWQPNQYDFWQFLGTKYQNCF